MPRKKRQKSETGVYHWIVRGMNKKDLFHEEVDYQRFMALLAEYKKTYLEAIYHYCLMTNHVHVLLKAGRLQYLRNSLIMCRDVMPITIAADMNGQAAYSKGVSAALQSIKTNTSSIALVISRGIPLKPD